MSTPLSVAAFIPARLESTRLPNKMLLPLGNLSVIATTYSNALASGLFTKVVCITDSDAIENEIIKIGGTILRSTKPHETGTDRIAEFADVTTADIIINIQGDEPFINTKLLQQIIDCFQNPQHQVVSAKMKIDAVQAQNPNAVKVVCNPSGNAILFSRSCIPYNRTKSDVTYYKHIGVYAFRKNALIEFAKLPTSSLEKIESLENLRFIENDIPIYLIETTEAAISIDTIEDWEKALELINC